MAVSNGCVFCSTVCTAHSCWLVGVIGFTCKSCKPSVSLHYGALWTSTAVGRSAVKPLWGCWTYVWCYSGVVFYCPTPNAQRPTPNAQRQAITHAHQVTPGQALRVTLADGEPGLTVDG